MSIVIFDRYDKNLIPGMYMNAEVDVKSAKATVLTDGAIVPYENKHFIFAKIDENKFEMREVDAGHSENGYTAIDNLDKN